MIFFVFLAFSIIGYAELRPLFINKDTKGLFLESFFIALAFIIAALRSLDIIVPSPVKIIETIIMNLLKVDL